MINIWLNNNNSKNQNQIWFTNNIKTNSLRTQFHKTINIKIKKAA